MSDASQSDYASTPFKFIVDGNPYYIHAHLVSRYSNPLDRMINGQMAEAQKGFAVLEEVDEGTFERFIEWAYKGYYTVANFELEASSPPPPFPCSEEECQKPEWIEDPPADALPAAELTVEPISAMEPPTDWDLGSFKKGKRRNKTKTRQELKESFIHHEHTVRREMISIPHTRANQGVNEDYTEVFLSHARLYVFAEKYDIQSLKTLALEELHNTLAIYTLYRRRTGDIVALLRYVYANTGVGEDLRTLLRDYIGYEMSVMMKDEEFKVLMVEDGGPLLSDFMEMVAKRID
ncbi:MAG: hypothetical protein M1827_007544 [Pycnora praestabilis]|nr:MAG: hypothetical protein M1827_007544 [Pycnora praestabilis]